MSIKGAIQAKEINDYGYARIKVSGTWYGGDKKGDISDTIRSGDIVEFDAYEKPGKDGKKYNNFKSQSLVKVSSAPKGAPVDKGPTASKDEYWAKKEENDAAKDPRITFLAAYDRAIAFSDLAIRNGAFDALAKAKPTSRLEVLSAFVYEQALEIMSATYAANVPQSADIAADEAETAAEEEETAESESWS